MADERTGLGAAGLLARLDAWSPGRAAAAGAAAAGALLAAGWAAGPWVALGAGTAVVLGAAALGRSARWRVELVAAAPEAGARREAPPGPGTRRELAGDLRIPFVWVPAGRFRMGSEDGLERERPVHEVRLAGLWVGETPVTQAQYQAVMGDNPSYFGEARDGGPDHPVEQVDWFEAVELCNRLSAREGLRPAYVVRGREVEVDADAAGYRLPTEAEWEYAARAGTSTRYWSGDGEADLARVGWYGGNSEGRTHRVGQKPANPWGLHDVHGNVWEWCEDRYGPYSAEEAVAPRGPSGGGVRVARGGSWSGSAGSARSAFRDGGRPGVSFHVLGLRVVRPAPRAWRSF